jgi:MarR family transcriptional regulator, transcriptional regulator for hemolysin
LGQTELPPGGRGGRTIDLEAFDAYHTPMDDSTHEPIGLLLTRSAKTVSRSFDAALAEHGGSIATWLILLSLTGEVHRSQRSIAADVGVEGPTLTHHLNRMEADGLLTRARDPQNRRAHQVELTARGRGVFDRLLTTVVGFDERLRAGFTDDELTTLRRLLDRLAANAGSAAPEIEEPA